MTNKWIPTQQHRFLMNSQIKHQKCRWCSGSIQVGENVIYQVVNGKWHLWHALAYCMPWDAATIGNDPEYQKFMIYYTEKKAAQAAAKKTSK